MQPLRPTWRAGAAVTAMAAVAVLLLAACGTSGSSSQSSTGTSGGSAPATNTIASQLVFGAGPECPQRDYCLKGLAGTYGLAFKDVKSLDSGGPLTVAALKSGQIQIGLIFTSDGVIAANDWVLLEDDKNLQPADRVTPIASNEVATAYGADLAKVLNDLSKNITTDDLVQLNKKVGVDKEDADAAAKAWLDENKLLPASTPATKSGPTIIIGSADFSESEILADIYADALSANGYPVEKKLRIGARDIYFPALTSGQINFLPEYGGTLLGYLKGTPSTDVQKTYSDLVAALKAQNVTAFEQAPAEDKNGFVVTKETADKYKLVKLSDLSKTAS